MRLLVRGAFFFLLLVSEYYSVNRRHRLEPSVLVIWDHVFPNSSVLLDGLRDHRYCKTKTLSQNPECLVACFSILGNLVELKRVEVEDPELEALGEQIFDTIQEFKSFQSSDHRGAHECGVMPSFYIKAKKALVDLGLIKVEVETKSTLDVGGKRRFQKSSTYTPTPKLKRHHFRHLPKEHSIPVDFPPTNLSEVKSPKKEKNAMKAGKKANPTKSDKGQKKEEVQFKNEGNFTFTASKKVFLPANGMKQEVFDMAKKLFGYENNRNHVVRGVFIFIDLLRVRYSHDPDDMGLTRDNGLNWLVVPEEDYQFTQKFLMEAFSNGGDGNKQTVNQVKQILLSNKRVTKATKDARKGLCWVKQEDNYNVGVSGDTFRFTEKFYHGSTDPFGCDEEEAYEIKNQKLRTKFEILAGCSLTPEALKSEFFDPIAADRKWNKKEKRKWQQALQNFDYNKGWFHQAREGGRVTTAIVGMPKEFRDQILIDGKPTVEIDIQSAHSLFIAHADEFRQFPEARKRWIRDVSSGDIYMKLAKKAEDAGATLPDISDFQSKKERDKAVRKVFKKFLNAYLNGGGQKAFNKVHKLGIQFKKHMEEWFPELHQVVQLLLERYTDKQSANIPPWDIKRNGAAIRLQQIESEIMGTHWMCNGHIPCISIHDGLLCKEDDADELIKAVKERAREILGFDVTVTRK